MEWARDGLEWLKNEFKHEKDVMAELDVSLAKLEVREEAISLKEQGDTE